MFFDSEPSLRSMGSNHKFRPMARPLIGVFGASAPSRQESELAREVGRLLAERGCAVVTGGLGGVMQEVSRGAHEAGGTVVGVVPQDDPSVANPHVDIAIATGMGDGRNAILANSARAFIAIGGSFGTLSEIAYALKRGKRVIGLTTWELDGSRVGDAPWQTVTSAAEAVEAVLQGPKAQ